MDFGGLAVGVSRGDALAEGLEAPHLGLGAAAGVVSGPPLPERPAVVARGAQGFVACLGGRAILLPRSTILAGRDDRGTAARANGAVAAAGVVVRPVRRAVVGWLGLTCAARLTAWIRDVNPARREFCNNAKVVHRCEHIRSWVDRAAFFQFCTRLRPHAWLRRSYSVDGSAHSARP